MQKRQAYSLLDSYTHGSEPEVFNRALKIQLRILDQLLDSNATVAAVISVADRLANGERLATNYAEVAEKLRLYDEGLKQLQDTLRTHPESQQIFRKRLHEFLNTLAVSGDTAKALSTIEADLDPQSLELTLERQRSTISSTLATLDRLARSQQAT